MKITPGTEVGVLLQQITAKDRKLMRDLKQAVKERRPIFLVAKPKPNRKL